MTVSARHGGRVTEEGALLLRNLPAWRASIQRQKGREVYVELHRVAEPTTQDQHGYYRSTLLPLAAEEWGWGNPAELHHELKLLHLPKIIPMGDWPSRRLGRDEVMDTPSMGDMTKEESSAFIQAVIDQMRDAGIVVPAPRGSEGA